MANVGKPARVRAEACAWPVVAVLTVACGGDPGDPDAGFEPCPPGTSLFTVSPVALEEVLIWWPLGNLSPPAHVFPSDHQGLAVWDPATRVPGPPRTVRSPGNIHVVRVRSSRYETVNTPTESDFSVEFHPCADVYGYMGHIQTLDPAFTNRLGPIDRFCNTYRPRPEVLVTTCETARLDIVLTPGEVIGTAGGVTTVTGIDFGLQDRRVTPLAFANPSRWESNSRGFDTFHVVAASDYFAEPTRSAILAKIPRTVPPRSGTIALDIPGTAQGAWFKPGLPTYPESPHLGLMRNPMDPTFHVFSVGTSHGGSIGAVQFQPAAAGTVNRGFDQVTPGPTIYCYERTYSGIVLLRLDTSTSLSLELRRGPPYTCAAAEPLAFNTAATVRYDR